MDEATRRRLAEVAVAGYPNGHEAPLRATARAVAKAATARSIVLVEGVSDQGALEALAPTVGRDLDDDGVVIVPVGGAQAFAPFLERFGAAGVRLSGLCDAAEEPALVRALTEAGIGDPASRDELAACGFFVCVDDLEDELLRAVGVDGAEALFDSQGDLRSFRRLQAQPEWRSRPVEQQMRRFFGSISRRKLRYGRLMALSLPLERIPSPLRSLLERA